MFRNGNKDFHVKRKVNCADGKAKEAEGGTNGILMMVQLFFCY